MKIWILTEFSLGKHDKLKNHKRHKYDKNKAKGVKSERFHCHRNWFPWCEKTKHFLGITLDPLYILCVLTLIKPGPSGTNFSYVILSLKSKFESQIYGVFFWQGVEDWVKWFKFYIVWWGRDLISLFNNLFKNYKHLIYEGW